MGDRDRVILGCLVVSGVCHVAEYWINRRLIRELDNGLENYTRLHESAKYLISIIEREDVRMTDFDAAALQIILSKD